MSPIEVENTRSSNLENIDQLCTFVLCGIPCCSRDTRKGRLIEHKNRLKEVTDFEEITKDLSSGTIHEMKKRFIKARHCTQFYHGPV